MLWSPLLDQITAVLRESLSPPWLSTLHLLVSLRAFPESAFSLCLRGAGPREMRCPQGTKLCAESSLRILPACPRDHVIGSIGPKII